jgi:uncharacterized membrane protein
MEIKGILLSLHLMAAVVWIGGVFFMTIIMRAVVSDFDAPERIKVMSRVFKYFFQWVWVAIAIILITGFSIIFGVYEGYGNLPWMHFKRIHLMTVIGLIMSVIFTYIYTGPFKGLQKAMRAKDSSAIQKNVKLIRLFGMVQLILGTSILIIVSIFR